MFFMLFVFDNSAYKFPSDGWHFTETFGAGLAQPLLKGPPGRHHTLGEVLLGKSKGLSRCAQKFLLCVWHLYGVEIWQPQL